jgi:molybdopterin synthase catalytic subunit
VKPSPDLVELRDSPLDAGAVISAVSEGGAGAIAMFLGTTRAESNEAGRRLVALDYEAYREMAEQQMHALANEAKERWPILRLAVLHRVGRVEIGQPSVLIAVSTPHRAEAFEACRFLIDRIKAEATIWKKEVWEDGSSSWVGERSGKPNRD